MRELDVTAQEVQEVVSNSDKKRFTLMDETGVTHIRAVQGHSLKIVDDDHLLQRLACEGNDLPRKCVHGADRRYYDRIRSKGLLTGGGQGVGFRNHVHFAPF